MLKNATLFRMSPWAPPPTPEIEERLARLRFTECGATQTESAGWIEPRGEKHGLLIENIGGQLILRLCTERKSVPSSVVKSELEVQLEKIEAETGRKPKGKRAKELKEEIVHSLLPRAFPKRSTMLVWIDLAARLVVVDASSLKAADRVVTLLVELLGGGITLAPLQTEISPATAMAEWLRNQEAPARFTVDRECELKQPDSEKAVVRYTRHTLDIQEVGEHIQQGKLPTKVAMTWNSRVSFVLTEALSIRKIRLLDVALESSSQGDSGDGFDTGVAITTGELRGLLADLVAALGGELAV